MFKQAGLNEVVVGSELLAWLNNQKGLETLHSFLKQCLRFRFELGPLNAAEAWCKRLKDAV